METPQTWRVEERSCDNKYSRPYCLLIHYAYKRFLQITFWYISEASSLNITKVRNFKSECTEHRYIRHAAISWSNGYSGFNSTYIIKFQLGRAASLYLLPPLFSRFFAWKINEESDNMHSSTRAGYAPYPCAIIPYQLFQLTSEGVTNKLMVKEENRRVEVKGREYWTL